jgi:hypothetical protein
MKIKTLIWVGMAIWVALLCAMIYFADQADDNKFPPRDVCPHVYETRHVKAQLCWKCHNEIVR